MIFLWSPRGTFMMKSGLCVLKGLFKMINRGVYGSSFIKKRQYFPKDVGVDGMIE